jgi:hypothetical protein
MAKPRIDEAVGALLVALKTAAICEFVAIMCADPEGIPTTIEGLQRSAEVMVEQIGGDFVGQYHESLGAGVLSPEESSRAALRPNRAGSIPP